MPSWKVYVSKPAHEHKVIQDDLHIHIYIYTHTHTYTRVQHVEAAVEDLPSIEVCLNVSALQHRNVGAIFEYALKGVLYPLQPLYDRCVCVCVCAGLCFHSRGCALLNEIAPLPDHLACFCCQKSLPGHACTFIE
jgi:hypothetical protein